MREISDLIYGYHLMQQMVATVFQVLAFVSTAILFCSALDYQTTTEQPVTSTKLELETSKIGKCDNGTFDVLCDKECHCLNDDPCDSDGICPNGGACTPNYGGPTCSDCAEGFFDVDANCTAVCHCANETHPACDEITGECDGDCAVGYNGTSCQEITGFPSVIFLEIFDVNVGQMAVVPCAASGAPRPNITMTSLSDVSGFPLIDRNDVSNGTIHESNFVFGPAFGAGVHEFNCLVENNFGSVNVSLNLTIIDPPFFAGIPFQNHPIKSVTSDSVHLTWKPWQYGVDFGGIVGDQVDYMVEYRATGIPTWSNTSIWQRNNSVTVDNLSPDTVYEFAVKCRRLGVGGEGHRGAVVQFVTKCGVPNDRAIPQNFVALPISSNSVLLSWVLPSHDDLRCELLKYELRYNFTDVGGAVESNITEIDGRAWSHTVNNLIPFTSYEFTLTAVTNGPPNSRYASVGYVTGKPGADVFIACAQPPNNPRTMSVSWQKPLLVGIRGYTVSAELVTAGECDQIPSVINVTFLTIKTPNTEVNLTDLRPFSKYNIVVHSLSDSGLNFLANVSAKTANAEPGVKPLNFEITSVGATFIVIQWNPIPCHEMNDHIVVYQYSVRQLPTRKRRSDFADVDTWTGYQNVSDYFVNVTGLVPQALYGIAVRGVTKFGVGPAATIKNWTTDITLLPPTLNISIVNFTDLLYTVGYADAAGATTNDEHLQYEIRVDIRFANLSTFVNRYISTGNQTEYLDKNVWQPGAEVAASVRAKNEDSWSAFSDVVVLKTPARSYLEAPVIFTIKHLNSSMVAVQWRPPNNVQTSIRRYKIQCVVIDVNSSSEPKWSAVESEHDVDTADNETIKVNLYNLRTGSAYCVRVAAVSVHGEVGFWADKTFFMEDDSSSRRMAAFPVASQFPPQPPPPILVKIPNLSLDATGIHIFPADTAYLYSQLMYYEVVVAMPDVIGDLNSTVCLDHSSVMERRADCWVAARLLATIVETDEHDGYDFIVGDSKTYGGYFNGPLLINQKYAIMLRTVDLKLENYSPMSSAVLRPLDDFDGPYSQAGGPAGICFVWQIPCVWFFVIVILVVILLWIIIACCMVCKITNHKKIKISREKPNNMGVSTSYRASFFDATAVELAPLNGGGTFTARMETFKKSNFFGPIKIRDLAEYVTLRKTHLTNNFEEEFKRVVRGQSYTWSEAKRPENIKKNRYGNILPYDQSRVRLELIPGIANSDYINASYVDGFDKPKSYIVTQGPKENTFHDFWRMVWQERVPIVVILTALVENKKKKCDQYWPNLSRLYGDILVHLMSTDYRADVVIRHFELKIVATCDVRRVTHYHYADWPDLSVPPSVTTILNLRHCVRDELLHNAGPIVVHCSGGAGRSGTFIAIDAMLQQAFIEDQVHVHNYINKIRTQRTSLVQTLDQYKFVYDALLEAVHSGNTKVSCGGFADYFQNVCRKSVSGDACLLEEQFETLNNFSQRRNCFPSGEALTAENACKNRDPTVLPIEHSRVKLKATGADTPAPYINAVQCDGFEQKGEVLATQMPLDCTIEDFWTMVFQFKSTVVVMLNDCEFIDENTVPGQYWPNSGLTQYGDFLVEVVAFEEKGMVNVRTLRVTNVSVAEADPHVVVQLQFLDWTPDDSVPSSVSSLVTVLNMADVLKSKYGGPITVHCTDGASRSGIFCAARVIKEQVAIKGEVDVFQSVKRLRQHRPQFITSIEQYRYCYEVALELMSSFGLNSAI